MPLILLMLLSVSVTTYAQSSMRSISDFSYLRNDGRDRDAKVEDFINDLRAGNRQAFKYVQYETAEGAIVRLSEEADNYQSSKTLKANRIIEYLTATTAEDDEKARRTLVRAVLPGIFNMDPRVRLVAADWLRGLRPDASMQRAVKLAVGVDIEVIRYDHKKKQFVFKAPRIVETVASSEEYYREKDIDWPTSLQSGEGGTNTNPSIFYQKSKQLRDGGKTIDPKTGLPENITTGLDARRWGDYAPKYNAEEGYVPLSADERKKIEDTWAEAAKQAVARAQAKYGAKGRRIYAPLLTEYRKYPEEAARDSDGVRKGAQLLMEQYGDMGRRVPLGQGRKYIYLSRESQILIANPWAELVKLDEYITRKIYWDKIVTGNKNIMASISKDTFNPLFKSIDGEVPRVIPILSLATNTPMLKPAEVDKAVDAFIYGLHKNPVLSNKYVMIRALKDIYVDRFQQLQTKLSTKEQINVALWEFRREANKIDVNMGHALAAESITVGKRTLPNDYIAIQPEGVTARLDIVKDLGFKTPNDEIRASGYKLITNDPTNANDPNMENKVNIDDRFNSIFYAYRAPDNSLVTWYNRQAEWRALAAGKNVKENVDRVDSPWIYNYEQMERAQKLINAILAGDGNVLKTAIWADVESAIILTLKRVQIKFEKAGVKGTATPTTATATTRPVTGTTTGGTTAANPGTTTTAAPTTTTAAATTTTAASATGGTPSAAPAAWSGAEKVVTTFFDQLRRQEVIRTNPSYIKDKTPQLRDKIFVSEEEVAGNYPNNTYSEEKRESIKRAAMGGLFNKDPRIRLTSVHFLRRLGPEEGMLDAVIQARSIVYGSERTNTPETDDNLNAFIDTNIYEREAEGNCFVTEVINRYQGAIPDSKLQPADRTLAYKLINPNYTLETHEYVLGMESRIEKTSSGSSSTPRRILYFGTYQIKSPGEELDKLYRFIQRRKLVQEIKKSGNDAAPIVKLSRADFGVLSEYIDNEFAARVPFISFHTTTQDRTTYQALPSRYAIFNENDIRIIKKGLNNSNFLVQKGCAEYLIKFYDFYTGFGKPPSSAEAKEHAVRAEIRNEMYFYKQDDIVVEEFVLAFEGEDPEGRAVILAGTPLATDMNPGGQRVYRTLPDPILMDIRDAILDETEKLPTSLKSILGLISVRAADANADLQYTRTTTTSTPGTSTSTNVGRGTTSVTGDTNTPPPSGSSTTTTTAAATTTTATTSAATTTTTAPRTTATTATTGATTTTTRATTTGPNTTATTRTN